MVATRMITAQKLNAYLAGTVLDELQLQPAQDYNGPLKEANLVRTERSIVVMHHPSSHIEASEVKCLTSPCLAQGNHCPRNKFPVSKFSFAPYLCTSLAKEISPCGRSNLCLTRRVSIELRISSVLHATFVAFCCPAPLPSRQGLRKIDGAIFVTAAPCLTEDVESIVSSGKV